jgi:hypothetical protein
VLFFSLACPAPSAVPPEPGPDSDSACETQRYYLDEDGDGDGSELIETCEPRAGQGPCGRQLRLR